MPFPLFLWATGVAGVALLLLSLRRAQAICRVIDQGTFVTGEIRDIWFNHMKGQGMVEYSYRFAGRKFRSRVGIVKNRDTKSISEGDEVELAVDRRRPDVAYIVSLYTNP